MSGQWNFFGNEGPNGEFVITSNANRVDAGRDIVVANPRNKLFVDDNGSDTNPGTQTAPFKTIQKGNRRGLRQHGQHRGGDVRRAGRNRRQEFELCKAAGDTTIIRPSSPAKLTALYTYPAGTFWPGTVMASTVLVKNTGAATVKDLKVDGVNVTALPAGASRLAGILYGESEWHS